MQFGSLHLEEVLAEEEVQSRDRAELLDEQDRTLQAGNGPAEDGSLQNSGRLNRMERGKRSLPTQEVSDEGSRCITQKQKTEAFFAQGVIRLQQLLLQDAVVTESSVESRKQSGMEKEQKEQNNIDRHCSGSGNVSAEKCWGMGECKRVDSASPTTPAIPGHLFLTLA